MQGYTKDHRMHVIETMDLKLENGDIPELADSRVHFFFGVGVEWETPHFHRPSYMHVFRSLQFVIRLLPYL